MTSKLKCPVCPMCGSELVRCKTFPYFYYCNCAEYEDIECELDDCAASVPVWEVLRRTNKQLEIARKALESISGIRGNIEDYYGGVSIHYQQMVLHMDEIATNALEIIGKHNE